MNQEPGRAPLLETRSVGGSESALDLLRTISATRDLAFARVNAFECTSAEMELRFRASDNDGSEECRVARQLLEEVFQRRQKIVEALPTLEGSEPASVEERLSAMWEFKDLHALDLGRTDTPEGIAGLIGRIDSLLLQVAFEPDTCQFELYPATPETCGIHIAVLGEEMMGDDGRPAFLHLVRNRELAVICRDDDFLHIANRAQYLLDLKAVHPDFADVLIKAAYGTDYVGSAFGTYDPEASGRLTGALFNIVENLIIHADTPALTAVRMNFYVYRDDHKTPPHSETLSLTRYPFIETARRSQRALQAAGINDPLL